MPQNIVESGAMPKIPLMQLASNKYSVKTHLLAPRKCLADILILYYVFSFTLRSQLYYIPSPYGIGRSWTFTDKLLSPSPRASNTSSCQFILCAFNYTSRHQPWRPNVEFQQRTKVQDVGTRNMKLKWNWAGHIARRGYDRWSKTSTDWLPSVDKRSVGRPGGLR